MLELANSESCIHCYLCVLYRRNIMRACTVSITPDCDEIDDTKVETWCPGK